MRLTEAEYQAYEVKRRGIKESPAKKPEAVARQSLRLVLPFKLPTWNRLLAMNHWQRAKIRQWIHDATLTCIAAARDSQTRTGSALRPLLTPSLLEEYSRMIAPSTSAKSRLAKNKAKSKKP